MITRLSCISDATPVKSRLIETTNCLTGGNLFPTSTSGPMRLIECRGHWRASCRL